MKLIDFFYKSKKISAKHSNYFDIYEALLKPYLNKKIVLVEIGVAAGGSLYMWKNYFEAHNKNGNQIRIIGVDIDPSVSELVEDGFEIYIGDQANPKFWSAFFSEVGKIDVLIDDGGHDNKQQIQTLVNSYSMINDGGIIIIEDIHQSLSWTVGNPHKFSFFQFLKLIETSLLEKSPGTKKQNLSGQRELLRTFMPLRSFSL